MSGPAPSIAVVGAGKMGSALLAGLGRGEKLGRVLVIDEQVPTPNQDSGSRRMWELLCILNDLGFGVTFLPNSGVDLPSYSGRLRDLGIEVLDGITCFGVT